MCFVKSRKKKLIYILFNMILVCSLLYLFILFLLPVFSYFPLSSVTVSLMYFGKLEGLISILLYGITLFSPFYSLLIVPIFSSFFPVCIIKRSVAYNHQAQALSSTEHFVRHTSLTLCFFEPLFSAAR